jgi:hypothetical protein
MKKNENKKATSPNTLSLEVRRIRSHVRAGIMDFELGNCPCTNVQSEGCYKSHG